MIVVNRFRVPETDGEEFRGDLQRAHDALASCAGYAGGALGRNVDDPTLWVLTTSWEHVGAYRRALSTHDVKLHAVPTLGRALDEPSAYEDAAPGADLNTASTRSIG